MSKKIFISLGNNDPVDNKIILDEKEIDLTGVSYFVLECDGAERNWIIAKRAPSLLTVIELLIQHLRAYLKMSDTK